MAFIEDKYKYLEDKFNYLCVPTKESWDIYEHLATLAKYASECESVFETGVRGVISSWALSRGLLYNGKHKKLIFMNDISKCNTEELFSVLKDLPIVVKTEWKNNLEIEFDQSYDLTFIDTWHVYAQLKRELAKFAPITNKYIIMHDTTVDEWEGESIRSGWNISKQAAETGFPEEEIARGLWPAVAEFVEANPNWVIHERYTNNNGLTILKRLY